MKQNYGCHALVCHPFHAKVSARKQWNELNNGWRTVVNQVRVTWCSTSRRQEWHATMVNQTWYGSCDKMKWSWLLRVPGMKLNNILHQIPKIALRREGLTPTGGGSFHPWGSIWGIRRQGREAKNIDGSIGSLCKDMTSFLQYRYNKCPWIGFRQQAASLFQWWNSVEREIRDSEKHTCESISGLRLAKLRYSTRSSDWLLEVGRDAPTKLASRWGIEFHNVNTGTIQYRTASTVWCHSVNEYIIILDG